MIVDGGVKHGVEVIEEVHHLHGSGVCRDGGEAHDVGEVDCDVTERLSLHSVAQLQVLCHSSGVEERVKQKELNITEELKKQSNKRNTQRVELNI